MSATDDPLWYKDAVIYQVHVKSFFDANNDGIGDFRGLTERLDYIKELGVSAIWLLPFYPSPLRDDGYDIADYKGVNAQYGSMRDVRNFIRAANRRGLRIITELVINHTSDQHPWFQRARKARRGSKLRDWYIWSDDDKEWPETRIIFTDTETSNWTWDPEAEQYFWHRFFSHQPDLNFDNPRVVDAVIDAMRYWLDIGVNGLRLDAIPYLVERSGTNNENLPETHDVIRHLRAAMEESHPEAFFLAEANQWPEDTRPYFGDGDECHMAFHFPLMPRMYMAIAQEDRLPITDILRQTPEIPANCQWAIFLRNHDELTLEMVTETERDYLWRFYATDSRARLNLGIRRRLAPLMNNDRRKIELMNSLLFSMPGTPIIYYGDEIGMGDNIFLGDRDGVRTPMQWSPDRNGGFSRADPGSLFLPPIMNSIYGFDAVNVEAQHRSPSSLLNWMRRIIAVRQQHKSFGSGSMTLLYPGNRKVLAYLRESDNEAICCVANLSRQAQAVELDLSRFKGRVPVEMIGSSVFPPIGDLTYLLTLPSYGFYWFLLAEEAALPSWHEEIPEPLPDFVTLVLGKDWSNLYHGHGAEQFAKYALPVFIPKRRWFAAKDKTIASARIVEGGPLPAAGTQIQLTIVEVNLSNGDTQLYFLPMWGLWDEAAVTTGAAHLPHTLAKIRRGGRVGGLVDATVHSGLAEAVVHGMQRETVVSLSQGSIHFVAGSGLADLKIEDTDEIKRLGVEQSNTSILIGEKMVLKVIRRLSPGTHPEVEIGRFLTEVAQYPNVPPQLGAVEYVDQDGVPTALAVLQGFARNQGDGWRYTLDYLSRALEEADLGFDGEDLDPQDRHAVFLTQMALLGQRTAELHRALSITTGDPAFDPEPIDDDDMVSITQSVTDQATAAFRALKRSEAQAGEDVHASVTDLLDREEECLALVLRLGQIKVKATKTRHHGDFHLGQVLIARDDFILVDFEGEPVRSLEERRAKRSPLRDVAGMLRSFDYAAAAALKFYDEMTPDRLTSAAEHALIWRNLTIDAFLGGYIDAIGDCLAFPEDPSTAMQLLDLLILEKALYEIYYEAANRPSWLPIPVNGVLAILDTHAPPKDSA